ncbi:MAG: hypothetical protein K2V38_12465, partial [Gemmataceae bacterium]|nr:hypothetical protein [Gemmataceae bacterium]
MLTSDQRAAIRDGRTFFGTQLANLLRYRPDYAEFLGSPDLVRQLEYALGGASAILLTEEAITSIMGVFSAGKTALLAHHLSEPLPSGGKPTSRLYAIIEPVPGLTGAEYAVGILGRTEAQRCLALLAEKVPAEIGVAARAALADVESVKEAAQKQYRCYLDNYDRVNPNSHEDRQTVADAAYLARSVAHALGDNEGLIEQQLTDGHRFSAKQQAAQYVAWDEDLGLDLGNPTDGKALEQAIEAWFNSARWSEFEQRNRHRPDLDAMRAVYQIGR